jgi:hypothetical protein
VHRRARQGERRGAQGRVPDRRQQGLHQGRPKNRLREQDIHRIVDTFTRQADVPRFARMVRFDEIADPKNDFNLNLPRYIDTTEPEDLQDIDGHLRGGIPERDIDALAAYWQVLPKLRTVLFESAGRPGYTRLRLPVSEVRPTIFDHPEFAAYNRAVSQRFESWRASATKQLRAFGKDGHPKALIERIAEDLLAAFSEAPLLDAYDVYQHLQTCLEAGRPSPVLQVESIGVWVTFPFAPAQVTAPRKPVETLVETPVETLAKTPEKILAALKARPDLTLAELASSIGESLSAVERATAKLVKEEKLRFVGPKKGGHWEVLE